MDLTKFYRTCFKVVLFNFGGLGIGRSHLGAEWHADEMYIVWHSLRPNVMYLSYFAEICALTSSPVEASIVLFFRGNVLHSFLPTSESLDIN